MIRFRVRKSSRSAGQRTILMATLTALLGVALAPQCHAVLRYTGVNLSGAEFGNVPTPGNLGTYNQAYTYPTSAEVNYYVGKGMNIFRLPFRWERMQPTQSGPLSTTELTRMDNFVNYATTHGAKVIVEPHNFQRYYPDPGNFQQSAQGLVGSAVPNSALVDFWTKMAEHYKSNGNVIFNLMNEPANVPVNQLLTTTNQVIAGIRSTGATNQIQVPGGSYTGAHSWVSSGNAATLINVVDPAQNMVFEAHQYFDYNSSGTAKYENDVVNPPQSVDLAQIGTNQSPNNVNIGVQRLTAMTNWLRTNNKRAFLGEFALPNLRFGTGNDLTTGDPFNRSLISDETLQATLNYIAANQDVWEGWAWWGGGPWWDSGDYMFGLGPDNRNYVTPVGESPALPYLAPYYADAVIDDAVGDFNLDRKVNALDLATFKGSFIQDLVDVDVSIGLTGTALAADASGDGAVDGADLLLWQMGLGNSAPASHVAANAIPEPTSLAMMSAVALALAYVRSRR